MGFRANDSDSQTLVVIERFMSDISPSPLPCVRAILYMGYGAVATGAL